MLKELESLLAQYARSRETLIKAVAFLNDTQLQVLFPDRSWSIHDTLAHLATNEALMLDLLEAIAEGTQSALPADFDNQHFNDEQVARRKAETTPALLADLEANYARLVAFLETLTPEKLNRRGIHPAAGDANVKEFFLAMYAHHEIHCRDVVEQARRCKKDA